MWKNMSLSDITMINKHDNERQMVQKVSTATPYLFYYSTDSPAAPGPQATFMTLSVMSLNTFHMQTFMVYSMQYLSICVYICVCVCWKLWPSVSWSSYNDLNEQNLNKLWDAHAHTYTHSQLLRHESVRVCKPEVTQHTDSINLSQAALLTTR